MTLRSDDQDPQRDAVYYAESAVRELLSDDDEYMDQADLSEFVTMALSGAGWDADTGPTVALDVPDDADWSGFHEGATQVIHLHPRLLSPWVVLHELAHWVDPRGAHGDRFCSNYIGLVAAGLGEDAARELLRAFVDNDVDVDERWLADLLRTADDW